jgi:GAF domain-containing protein
MLDDAEQRSLTRQALTATAFVELVETLVSNFDVIEVLTGLTSRCVELVDAAAAGILLADSDGHLRVIGASSEQVTLLELFQIQYEQGPCMEAYTTGKVVIEPNMGADSRWPQFSTESLAAGFPSVCAIPMRLGSVVLGCLNLFMSVPLRLSDDDVALAQALADVASIAIMQDEATRLAAVREGQLLHALTSRIVIEQAKGMIAEHSHVDMDGAFSLLRGYTRKHNRRLTDVAEAVVAGRIAVHAIARTPSPPQPPKAGKSN